MLRRNRGNRPMFESRRDEERITSRRSPAKRIASIVARTLSARTDLTPSPRVPIAERTTSLPGSSAARAFACIGLPTTIRSNFDPPPKAERPNAVISCPRAKPWRSAHCLSVRSHQVRIAAWERIIRFLPRRRAGITLATRNTFDSLYLFRARRVQFVRFISWVDANATLGWIRRDNLIMFFRMMLHRLQIKPYVKQISDCKTRCSFDYLNNMD